jgi:SAM-dependent methyltransferase
MIVCTRCRSTLRDDGTHLVCAACGYYAQRDDGFLLFDRDVAPDHEDYRSDGLDALYAYEQKHFWFRHRRKLIIDAFRRHVDPGEEVMEVGAGTGFTARALQAAGYRHLSVGEIHRNGLAYARNYGVSGLYQFDLRASPFVDHFDAVALFDVIEHIAQDDAVAANIHRMLRAGGRVLVTVPAHQWLWSRIDELSGHHRRYDRRSLTALFERNGFEMLECRYFFTALVPAFWARSLMARRTTRETIAADCGMEVSPVSNTLLGLAGSVGDVVLAPLRALTGGSLLAVAKKRT